MNWPSFEEIFDRMHQGATVEEQAFDMRLFEAVERMKRKYDIRYDREHPVPTDDAMADRCFAAGRELYAEVGTYCVDTHRVARFSLEEMDAALDGAPSAVTWGTEGDARELAHRPVASDVPVFVYGGIQTILFSDEQTMLAVYRACCRCRDVHGIWGGIVPTTEAGTEVRGGTPQEVRPYRRSALLLRQAAAEAGRPGMCVRTGAPSVFVLAAQYAGADGLRPTDGIGSDGRPELKVSFDDLARTAFAQAIGSKFLGGHGATIGAFSGSVEGAAIVTAASAYQSRLVNRGDVIAAAATPMQVQSRATRNLIWVNSLALQALNRNTHLIVVGPIGDHPAAGPGTKQYCYETAAALVPGVACGAHMFGGTRKFKIGKTLDYGTPAESAFMGRLARAAVGIEPAHADRIAADLLARYEDHLQDPPPGATLHELYDLEHEQPLPAYRAVLDEATAELRALGVPLDDGEA